MRKNDTSHVRPVVFWTVSAVACVPELLKRGTV
jgi:hypothetical protein